MHREYNPGVTGPVDVPVSLTSQTTVQPKTPPATTIIVETEDVATELLHDLERLHELKHNFELMFTEDGNIPATVTTEPKRVEPVAKQHTPEIKEEPEVKKDTSKSKRERIIEMAKAMEASHQAEAAAEET